MALHVRIADSAYFYLDGEARQRGISKARLLTEILLGLKLAHCP